MQFEQHSYNHFINELTLLNFENLGTPRQETAIARVIQNWDNRRYLKIRSTHLLCTSNGSFYLNKKRKPKIH